MNNSLQCLMIKTKDHRKFFTDEKNYPQLLEFSKTFKAEISVVKTKEIELLELSELAPAICDANYPLNKTDYELVEVITPCHPTRSKILKNASSIKSFIVNKFLARETVSLKELKNKFKRFNLSTPTLCNHIRRVRDELKAKGVKTKKVGTGKYQHG